MEQTTAARNSKSMKLRILIGLAVTAASFCTRTEAQTTELRTGTVLSWGAPPILWPYSPPGTRYQAIAAGTFHSLALKSDGTLIAWGYNMYGQRTVPANLTDVIAIAAGGNHSLALKVDGTVVAWGDNSYGESTV